MKNVDWGYVLIGPGRPEREAQRRVMHYAGVKLDKIGTCWQDKPPPRPTRPRSALIERNLLLSAARSGDQVHVATLMCLGVSGTDAAWFAEELGKKDVMLIIHEGMREIRPGDDVTGLAEDFDRARNALQVSRHRAKKRKS
jgi:hypothetical protein